MLLIRLIYKFTNFFKLNMLFCKKIGIQSVVIYYVLL